MKTKRKGEPRTDGGRILKRFGKVTARIAILPCLFTFCLMTIMRDYDRRIDDIGVERLLTQVPKIPQSRRERSPEAKIEFEELKKNLFGVVDNTIMKSLFEDTYIELSPPYCIVGRSINSVTAKDSFADVVERYKAWADQNGWHSEEIKVDAGESGENSMRISYWRPSSMKAQRTQLEIESFSIESSSGELNSSHYTHYHLRLRYVDRSCVID